MLFASKVLDGGKGNLGKKCPEERFRWRGSSFSSKKAFLTGACWRIQRTLRSLHLPIPEGEKKNLGITQRDEALGIVKIEGKRGQRNPAKTFEPGKIAFGAGFEHLTGGRPKDFRKAAAVV